MNVEQVESEYEKEVCRQAARNSEFMCLLGLLFFPLFALLDIKNHSDVFPKLLFIRFLLVGFLGVNYFIVRRLEFITKPMLYFSFLVLVSGIAITWMNIVIGIENSPKFVGIILAILAVSTLTPADGWKVFSLNAMLILTYASGAFILLGPEVINEGELLFNLAIMLTTGVIGASSSHLTEGTRKSLFFSYYETKSAKLILRKQLKSKKLTLDDLAEEVSKNKQHLENALEMAEDARNKAEKAMRLRDDFISVASHELKTPLSVLKTQVDLLELSFGNKMMRLSSEDTQNILKNFNRNVENINRLIDDMRDVTRVESGNLELHKMQVNLNELIKKILYNFKISDKADIQLFEHEQVIGRWDPFRLEQVVVNLTSNALKYGGEKSPEVHVKVENGLACIEVIDFGQGISAKNLKKVFEKYGRINRDSQTPGLGLGLYITKKIIDSHRGDIQIKSVVGKGTTFKVLIPLN